MIFCLVYSKEPNKQDCFLIKREVLRHLLPWLDLLSLQERAGLCVPPFLPPQLPRCPTENASMAPASSADAGRRRATSAQLRPRVLTRCLNIASPPAPTLWVNCKFCRLLTVCSSGGEKKSYFGSLCQDQENEFRSRGEEARRLGGG